MELSLHSNVQSTLSCYNLQIKTRQLNKDFEKAASGLKINTTSDDAAGVSVSDGIMTQVRGRKMASQAIQDGTNMLNIADGALGTISEHIQRIRELSIQAANDVNTSTERRALVEEVNVRLQDIDRIANATQSNRTKLLDGSASQFKIQVGAESDVNLNTINIGSVLNRSTASAIGFNGLNITAAAGGIFADGTSARSFLNNVDNALNNLIQNRSRIAAYQQRLESTLDSANSSIEGYTRSYSSIRDANMAEVTSDMIKQKILRESTLNVMMQSNQNAEVALSLLSA